MGGPLEGIRVVDFSHWAVGPFCGMLLGATVVKVDPPEGDGLATVPPAQRGAGTPYLAVNLYKDNLRLDLKSPDGLRHAFALIREALLRGGAACGGAPG
jgi:crotonobetainyl-CoA:carnitine CoA-transferase CaiB-like acyl-CoA transferase